MDLTDIAESLLNCWYTYVTSSQQETEKKVIAMIFHFLKYIYIHEY